MAAATEERLLLASGDAKAPKAAGGAEAGSLSGPRGRTKQGTDARTEPGEATPLSAERAEKPAGKVAAEAAGAETCPDAGPARPEDSPPPEGAGQREAREQTARRRAGGALPGKAWRF